MKSQLYYLVSESDFNSSFKKVDNIHAVSNEAPIKADCSSKSEPDRDPEQVTKRTLRTVGEIKKESRKSSRDKRQAQNQLERSIRKIVHRYKKRSVI